MKIPKCYNSKNNTLDPQLEITSLCYSKSKQICFILHEKCIHNIYLLFFIWFMIEQNL